MKGLLSHLAPAERGRRPRIGRLWLAAGGIVWLAMAGCGGWSEGGSVEDLIALARERLHAAKCAGRDRVVA